MKNQITKKCIASIGMGALLCMVALSSCLKDNYQDYPIDPDPLSIPAQASFIQASPDAAPLDLYLDNNLVNKTYSIKFTDQVDYFYAYTGKRQVNIYAAGSTNKLASDTATLKKHGIYTIILANKISTPNIIVLTDSIARPAAGKATVRFINLSPEAVPADLAVKSGSVLVSNKTFKGYSSFVPVTGNATYTFEIRQTGTTTVLATLPGVTLKSGYLYTIWLGGLTNGTGTTALSANIIINGSL